MKVPGVEQMQIEQISLHKLIFRIVVDTVFSEESRNEIKQLSKKLFGPRMECVYQYVDELPQEARGKYRFVISHIKEEEFK